MSSNIENDNSTSAKRHDLWCGSRSGGIFCGLMMVVIGVIWIGKKTGIIPLDMALFWPSVMVIAGVWMLAAGILRKRRPS